MEFRKVVCSTLTLAIPLRCECFFFGFLVLRIQVIGFTNQKICHRAAADGVVLVGDLLAKPRPQKPNFCSMPALGNRTIKIIRAQQQNVIIRLVE